MVHCMQPTRTYNAPKPEQKTVQVKDSLTKPSYQQKPLPRPPEREGNSMNITCYECGQVGHIRTNCPRLMKVRTAAVMADGTEDPEILLSLEFTRATGIKMFALEKPIALQLACIGS